MVALGEIVSELGGALPVEVLASPGGLDHEVSGLSIYDVRAPDPEVAGTLVLGIGLSPTQTGGALGDLAAADAAALLVKAEAHSDLAEVAAAAEQAGLPVLVVPAGIAWMQVQSLTMATLAEMTTAEAPHDGLDSDDLFGIADTIAELVDAPILIQDRHMHLLAFSGRQEEADGVRREVILQRGIPPRYARRLEELKILQKVLREREPVYFEPLADMDMGRVAMAVRAGDELLGTVTAAVPSPPTEEQRRILSEAAKLIALRMLRQRVVADAEERHTADQVASLLEGGVVAAEAADRLGLDAGGFRIMACGIRSAEEVDAVALQRGLRAALESHLSLFRVTAATALLGGVVYTVLPANDPASDRERLLRLARTFTGGTAGRVPRHTLIGIGGHAPTPADVPRARQEADDALRVLRSAPDLDPVAEIDDVRLRVWLLRLHDVLGDEPALSEGPLEPVIAHDATHGTEYLETLRAYLEAMGDTARIAEDLGVHVNTVRYRLRRLQEFTGLHLDDPDRRLELQLRLRLRTLTPPST